VSNRAPPLSHCCRAGLSPTSWAKSAGDDSAGAASSGFVAATGGAGTVASIGGIVRRRTANATSGGMVAKRARLLDGSAAATDGDTSDEEADTGLDAAYAEASQFEWDWGWG